MFDRDDNGPNDPSKPRVGYGKPPREHQFKKGKSGNPKGRPKKPKMTPLRAQDRPSRDLVVNELYEPIVGIEGGREVEISRLNAIYRKGVAAALGGNRLWAKMLIEKVEAEEARQAELAQTLYDRMLAYRQECWREIERCQERGVEPPDFVPHPDDIILDPFTLDVGCDGAVSAEDKDYQDRAVQFRDYCLLMIVYTQEFMSAPPPGEEFQVGIFSYYLEHFQKLLPKRLRLSPEATIRAMESALWQGRWEMEKRLIPLSKKIGMNFRPAPAKGIRPFFFPVSLLGMRYVNGRFEKIPKWNQRKAYAELEAKLSLDPG